MSQNIISAELTVEKFTSVLDTIKTLKNQLDFLVDLDADQRHNLAKLGDASQAFVERSLDLAQSYPDILPGRFDMDKFYRDTVLVSQLRRLEKSLAPLIEKLSENAMAAGGNAYSQALEVYSYAKAAGTGDGLDELRWSMSRRFV